MIILDLAAEIEPVWKRTGAFYGKPWIWNMLNNFGANTNLFGRMDVAAHAPAEAYHAPTSGSMKGIGLTMEGIEQNPVLYELLTDNTWRNQPINVDTWLPQYILNRYGKKNAQALKTWDILRKTVYSVPVDRYVRDGAESIIQGRPTTDSSTRWARTSLNYRAQDLLPAWKAMINATGDLSASDGFRFDLVDITRQVLANYALPLQRKAIAAYRQKNITAFKQYSGEFIDLIQDMDKLLATRKEFLLGPWIADARRWGRTPNEKARYEMNAKDLITLWGDKDCPLNEYACKQWSGLFNDFYKPRWKQFFTAMELDLTGKKRLDKDAFVTQIKNWEWAWVNTRKDYATTPVGDPVKNAKMLYRKYWIKTNELLRGY
jgi:alpha-N-acetylglucosaminidase